MEIYRGYTCVTVDELTDKSGMGAIMSLSNYKQLTLRKRINIVRKGGGLDGYVLIDYQTLPERFKSAYITKYGDPMELLKKAVATDSVLEDALAREYYTNYEPVLSDDKIEEYTMNASVIKAVVEALDEVRQMRRGKRDGVPAREIAMELIERFRQYPGHTLATSWVRISAKIKEYKERGYSALVQGYIGNQRSRKITDEVGRQIVALKRSMVPIYTNEQIFEEINKIGEVRGWKPIKSINSIVSYLNSPEVMPLWYDAKLGGRAAKQKFGRKHKTILPQMRDALWYGDGTKVNLYYKAIVNGRLVMRTTQVYEVMDAYSEVFLGYHISDRENYAAQLTAHRMAVEVAGCRPFEIVYDNQSGLKSIAGQAMLDKIARIHRPTAPYNASSKSIEAAFGRFQHMILSRDWRFTGQNITSRGEFSRPNIELIEANVQNLYTYEELLVAYARAREEWNAMTHPITNRPRIEMYHESVNPEAQPITMADMVEIFWHQHEQTVTFTTWGVTISVDSKKYQYEVYGEDGYPDLEFRKTNTYRKFIVKYDPMDMTTVRLYTQDSRGGLKFSAEARPYQQIHRAIQEQQDGEMEFIRTMDERMKRSAVAQHLEVVELEMEHGVAPEQHGLNRPKIAGMSLAAAEKYMEEVIEHPTTIGTMTKVISNTTYDQLDRLEKY